MLIHELCPELFYSFLLDEDWLIEDIMVDFEYSYVKKMGHFGQ